MQFRDLGKKLFCIALLQSNSLVRYVISCWCVVPKIKEMQGDQVYQCTKPDEIWCGEVCFSWLQEKQTEFVLQGGLKVAG